MSRENQEPGEPKEAGESELEDVTTLLFFEINSVTLHLHCTSTIIMKHIFEP